MKTVILVLLVSAVMSLNINAQRRDHYWSEFSGKIIKTLGSGNAADKEEALQFIIQYSDSLEVRHAAKSIMSIYRSNSDIGLRQLALIALYKIKDDWAMEFLKMNLKYEDEPKLKKIAYNCLVAYYNDSRRDYWKEYSNDLVQMAASKNLDTQLCAMQLIIQHAESLDVSPAVFDIMRVFRDSKDQSVRQLALVTLFKMRDSWSMDFLRMSLQYEENPKIKKMCCCGLQNYFQSKLAYTPYLNGSYLLATY